MDECVDVHPLLPERVCLVLFAHLKLALGGHRKQLKWKIGRSLQVRAYEAVDVLRDFGGRKDTHQAEPVGELDFEMTHGVLGQDLLLLLVSSGLLRQKWPLDPALKVEFLVDGAHLG